MSLSVAENNAGTTAQGPLPTNANPERKTIKPTSRDFMFNSLIGEGSFSTVMLATELATNKNFAIKICDKDHIYRENKTQAIMRERSVLNILVDNPSPFFVKLFCTFQDHQRLYFVLNYCENGELLPYIKKVGSFDEECTRFYAAEILLGLEHLHRLNIVHRDLKPENILLTNKMHIQITDFGSSYISEKGLEKEEQEDEQNEVKQRQLFEEKRKQMELRKSRQNTEVVVSDEEDANDENNENEEQNVKEEEEDNKQSEEDKKEETDKPNEPEVKPQMKLRRPWGRGRVARCNSFVGTAQYVSPEMLTNRRAGRASDLWALGCIIYQMTSGLPPFRAPNEYLVFQKVIKIEYEYPDGFNATIRDLIEKLFCRFPSDRLGAKDKLTAEDGSKRGYESIRSHPFFEPLRNRWNTLHQEEPPRILPYLPSNSKSEELRSQFNYVSPEKLEPGLDDRQMNRLLSLALYENVLIPVQKSILDISSFEFEERLKKQRETNEWHPFVENNLILKQGLIDKRKGLFTRRRMFLLTTGPHLYYVDPVARVLKGEIPWSEHLRTESKNFRVFFIHTPNRVFYLEDPEGGGPEWCKMIEEIRIATFCKKDPVATSGC